jgi:DNA helicase II / ATP-dependent DNA helicase PcrA
MEYLASLNDRQREAVITTEGPLLVLAGAGSGKTRVITYRILHLIEKGVAPYNILAVTFTNKAAKEMRERVIDLIREHHAASRASMDSYPPAALSQDIGSSLASRETGRDIKQFMSLPLVTTFHALGARMLREHHEAVGLAKHFAIYDRSDSVRTIKKALEKAGYGPKQFEPRTILAIISKAKGDALSRLDFLDRAKSYPERVAAEVWEHYEHSLREDHAVDFDDLLIRTLHMLQSNPGILRRYRDTFRYIHVDEYQDTNKVQYEIVRTIAGDNPNICVVGDVDQNIYSWRGANIANILQFERHFPGTKIVLLEENYRSTQTIIAASNDIIAKNINRPEKTVFTKNREGEPISLYAALNGTEEAEHVAIESKKLIANGVAPSEIAVLYRTNFQSRVLEEAFINMGVPYQLVGTRFFERKEIKDVLSFLRLAMNPQNMGDLARIINVPPRGIGKITLLKLIEGKRDSLTGKTLEKVNAFDELMMDIALSAREKKLSETLRFIIKRTGLEDYLRRGGDEDLERLENLRELVTLATKYDEFAPEDAVLYVLEEAALQSDQDEIKSKEEKDAVRLMTVHAAKGLEFSYVFITGLEEGLFPHERLSDERIDEEEERRLFYVALTRAKNKLFLSFAHMRTIFGAERINVPSSFLSDIREELLEEMNPRGFGEESGFERTVFLD